MIALERMPIIVDTPRLVLRPLREEEVTDEYVAGLNDPLVNEYLVSVRLTRQTRETVTAYVTQNCADPHAILFGLFLRPNARLIGTVRLHGIEPVHGTASLGVCIFLSEFWGKGYSSEAIVAVTEWAFSHLAVRYVEAGCYEANIGSVRTFLRAGFTPAARFEDKYLLRGQPVPVVFLRRLAHGPGIQRPL